MKNTGMRNLLAVIGVVVLVAALALSIVGCGSKTEAQKAVPETTAPVETQAETESGNVLGNGSTVFTFVAVDLEGKETQFEIHTDAAMLGEALLEHKLIEGEMGQYGLYVTSVNGIPLDWEKDGKYWSLLIDGEYAMTGVDATEIVAGTTYTFAPA